MIGGYRHSGYSGGVVAQLVHAVIRGFGFTLGRLVAVGLFGSAGGGLLVALVLGVVGGGWLLLWRRARGRSVRLRRRRGSRL